MIGELPAAREDLKRRRWIWQAVSELFLDDEVTEDALRHIARVGAECGYTGDELEAIYRREVAPAVAFNVLDTVGAWGYFDTIWLESRILRPHRIGYWLNRLILAPLVVRDLRHEWKRVKYLLEEARGRVIAEQENQGGEWKPCWAEEAPCLRWGDS